VRLTARLQPFEQTRLALDYIAALENRASLSSERELPQAPAEFAARTPAAIAVGQSVGS
jgi:hypothetical protein